MKYVSLYDYLRKPAGKKLGGEVFSISQKCGVVTQDRLIKSSSYEGRIKTYPIHFLNLVFKKQL